MWLSAMTDLFRREVEVEVVESFTLGSGRLAEVAMTLFVNTTKLDFYDIQSAADLRSKVLPPLATHVERKQSGRTEDEKKYLPIFVLHLPVRSPFFCVTNRSPEPEKSISNND